MLAAHESHMLLLMAGEANVSCKLLFSRQVFAAHWAMEKQEELRFVVDAHLSHVLMLT